MKPLYERVLVKPIKKPEKTSSGILLTSNVVKRPNLGTVIKVGPGNGNQEMQVKEGDKIIFNRYAGIDIRYKGELHYVILVNEIIATLDNLDDIETDDFE